MFASSLLLLPFLFTACSPIDIFPTRQLEEGKKENEDSTQNQLSPKDLSFSVGKC